MRFQWLPSSGNCLRGSVALVEVIFGFLFLSIASVACVSCSESAREGGPRPTGRCIVVLVDHSQSTSDDHDLVQRTIQKILSAVQDGDRFLLAPITAASGEDSKRTIDVELPPSFPDISWNQEPIRYRKEKRNHDEQVLTRRTELQAGVESLLSEPHSALRTTIIEALRTLKPLFRTEKRDKYLIIVSDMVEDSDIANFDRQLPAPGFAPREVERQRSNGILPDLAGVSVYVAGALASPPGKAAAIEKFWTDYLTGTGAVVRVYSRVLPSFP